MTTLARRLGAFDATMIVMGGNIGSDYGETHHDGKIACRCKSEACRRRL